MKVEKRKGRPFLEVFASALHEDYRFPILELFAFLYVLGAFALSTAMTSFSSQVSSLTEAAVAYQLTSSILILPLFIFVILIFKNIAYGLGSDIEKGIIQTYFSYPLKRRGILTAKLLSALGVSIVLFLVFQISALYIIAPDIVLPQIGTVLLTYLSNLSYPLLIAGIVMLFTFVIRRGGIALIVGVFLYLALSIANSIITFFAYATESTMILQVFSFISPGTAVGAYYASGTNPLTAFWEPTFSQVAISIVGSYAIVAVVFFICYYYFSRRLNL
jgi:ABC-type transport system involved in multi-copper enzyme maturation permease subunit